MHDRFDLHLTFGAQHAVKIERPDKLECRVDHENLGKGFRQLLLFPQVIDGLPHRPEGRYSHELGLHAATGRALRVIQRAHQSDALGERQL